VKNYCIDCQTELKSPKSKRCYSCNNAFRWSNKEYKNKVSAQIAKGNKTTKGKRVQHSLTITGKNNPNYKDGSSYIKTKCLDCNAETKIGIPRCRSCASKYKWTLKSYQKKMVQTGKQNKKEAQVEELLNKLFKNEYKYVGNRQFFVGRFNPDFININGKTKIIEFYGDYWHTLPGYAERDKQREITYIDNGYQLLVIWEHELTNLNKLQLKIIDFHNK